MQTHKPGDKLKKKLASMVYKLLRRYIRFEVSKQPWDLSIVVEVFIFDKKVASIKWSERELFERTL